MKVLCVDNFIDGHHISYLNGIGMMEDTTFCYVVPEYVESSLLNIEQVIIPYDVSKRGFFYDQNWLSKVHKAAIDYKPDVIHFLYGDLWYRYLGLGLSLFRDFNTVITFHVIPDDLKHRVGIRRIAKCVNKCVVHTDKLYNQLTDWGVTNLSKVEYPCFFPRVELSQEEIRRDLGIPKNKTVLAALGGTRKYKGLDLLLDALNKVTPEFHLLIAGSEEYFTEDFIKEKTRGYQSDVTTLLRQLTDDEFIKCIVAADWIVLPYRKNFTGASGPLAEGVVYGKRIIGTSSGSIGELIQKNDLGIIYESENVESLSMALNLAIKDLCGKTHRYENYRMQLNPTQFAQKYNKLYRKICDDEKK